MKNTFKILLIGLFVVLISVVGLTNRLNLKEISEKDAIRPDLLSIKLNAKLYFVFGDKLRKEERIIEFFGKDYVRGLGQALQMGPKNKIYETPFKENITIQSAEVVDKIAYINLSENAEKADFWKDDNCNVYIFSIVNTFTENDDISQVQILIDGKVIEKTVKGVSLAKPIERNEDFIYVKEPHPSDMLIQFLDNIYLKRFDIAYEQIDSESRDMLKYKEFVEMMEDYYRRFYNYQRGVYFTQDFKDTKIVHVKYVLYEDVLREDGKVTTRSANAIFDDWELIEDKGVWKVNFKNK